MTTTVAETLSMTTTLRPDCIDSVYHLEMMKMMVVTDM
jgi:hypothetical protein